MYVLVEKKTKTIDRFWFVIQIEPEEVAMRIFCYAKRDDDNKGRYRLFSCRDLKIPIEKQGLFISGGYDRDYLSELCDKHAEAFYIYSTATDKPCVESFNVFNYFEELKEYCKDKGVNVYEPYQYAGKGVEVKFENLTGLSDDFVKENMCPTFFFIKKANLRKLGTYFPAYVTRVPLDVFDSSDNIFSKVAYSGNTWYFDSSFADWYDYHMYEPIDNFKISNKKVEKGKGHFFCYADATSITVISFSSIMKMDKNGVVSIKVTKNGEFFYDVLGEKRCRKFVKDEPVDISPFEFFNINARNINFTSSVWHFKDACGFADYMIKNPNFFEKSGYLAFMSVMKSTFDCLSAIILFLSLVYEYPSIELLIKAGHFSLVGGFWEDIISSKSKDIIFDKAKEIGELIHADGQNSKSFLRFPPYIGDYLRKTNASLSTYKFWRDVYEIEHITKDDFDKFVLMPQTIILNSDLCETEGDGYFCQNTWYNLGLQDIIKYDGWKLTKTIKYAMKNAFEVYGESAGRLYNSVTFSIQTIKDTLMMAEVLGVEVEPYPSDIHKIHNELSGMYNKMVEENKNEILKNVSNTCTIAVDSYFSTNSASLPKKQMAELMYVFPAEQKDFSQEGISQHNCVSGYSRLVKEGACIIFFVRKKETPNQSYITAEITKNGLHQVMYSHNRPVSVNSSDYAYCRHISNAVINAYKNKKICGFDNMKLTL